ncbi:MAG: ATP-binding cassette domain-containing protein [Deltaproteobacteria bacterium]|nr:ATP-binding cassette domain-containing protein [Deltaproteobacteria bacterium]
MKSQTATLFKRIFQYSRPYLWRIGGALCASLVVGATDVASAKLVQPLVDRVLQPQDRSLIPLVPFFIVGLFVLKGGAKFLQEYYIKTSGALVVQDIRNSLYSHSLGLSLGYINKNTAGNFMSRILNDVGQMQRSAADMLVDGARESIALIGLTALAFYNDWQLAIAAFLVLPLSFLPASYVGRRIKKNSRGGQQVLAELTAILQETFSGMKVIKSFGTEDLEREKFVNRNRNFYHFLRKVIKYDSLSAPVIEILASFGIAAVFWFGIYRVIDGRITLGELFSFGAAVLMMYAPLRRLIKINNTLQTVVSAAERVFEILDQKADIVDRPGAVDIGRCRGEVAFRDVTFSYGDNSVLKNFSIEASPGEIVALVGPSGAGKTTAAALLSRFFDVSDGQICIDGHDIRALTLASLRKNIAMVDQDTFLFNDTVTNNIRYGRPDATLEEVKRAAEAAYADQFILELPNGYEEMIGDRGVRLSGGQRQRLCIARALLMDAPIMILDEATSALDTESEKVVQKALHNLMLNRTTFVIAHRLSTVQSAHKIVVLEDGLIKEQGTHQELLHNRGLYHKLYEIQFMRQDDSQTVGPDTL